MFFAWCAHFKALGEDDTAVLAFRNRENVFVRSTLHGPRGATVRAVNSMPADRADFPGRALMLFGYPDIGYEKTMQAM